MDTKQTEGLQRELVGKVLSNKMMKTVVVIVERHAMHPFYKKVLKKTSHLKAHDETGQCQVGDRVVIRGSRPLSREKHWKVVKVLERVAVSEGRRT